MNEIQLSKLKTDETINNLIPEMTEKEYLDLKTSIENDGLRHAIDINHDNTILDGRHRVKVFKSLGVETISCVKHDLNKSEAIKFVRDTAVERRHLTEAQRLNIILNSEDVIAEISERAKKNQSDAIKEAHKSNPNHKVDSFGPSEPKLSKPKTNTNAELGKLAGVSKSTVVRAKKVKRENPEAYEKVIKGESTFAKEYNALPTVKKPKVDKEVKDSNKQRLPVKQKEDLRTFINEHATDDKDELLMLRVEGQALNFVERCKVISKTLDGVTNEEMFIRYVSTLDVSSVVKAKKVLETIIKNGGFK